MSDITESMPAAAPAPSAAPSEYRGRGGDAGGPGGRPRRRYPRRKVCYFTAIKAEYIDYKDGKMLRRFVSDTGKILPRRVTGTCSKWQRALTTAVKRARQLALLPYKSE